MIKNQEIEMQEKKRRDQEEKKSKGRQDLINKILEENHKRQKIEVSLCMLNISFSLKLRKWKKKNWN